MNYDSILRRVRKAVEKAESRGSASSVHILTIDDSIENLSGLVIILAELSPEQETTPQPTNDIQS